MLKTLNIDDNLLHEAEAFATQQGTNLNTLIETSMREMLQRYRQESKEPKKIKLPTFHGDGLQPGIDLNNSHALLDLMEKENGLTRC
jgi:hypothetical protein